MSAESDLMNGGSGIPGSPNAPVGSQSGQAGSDYEKAYHELESRFGTQGQELGEYREFFKNLGPLLDKLDNMPELVKAIEDGKIDEGLATAILEGKVTVGEAKQAVDEVKSAIGKKAFDKAAPEDISKLVDEKVGEIRHEMAERDELSSFEAYTRDFIVNTPDFVEYADSVDQWLSKHSDITDIEVAYYAVKGHMSESSARRLAEQERSEGAKAIAMNAVGGQARASYSEDGVSLVDKLISGRPNPNAYLGGF